MGLGALIWETDSGRPLGMSTDSEARWREERCESLDDLDDEECLEELLLLEDLWDDEEEEEEDLCEDERRDDLELTESTGTSKMFSSRPVVGSVVEVTLGLWATW